MFWQIEFSVYFYACSYLGLIFRCASVPWTWSGESVSDSFSFIPFLNCQLSALSAQSVPYTVRIFWIILHILHILHNFAHLVYFTNDLKFCTVLHILLTLFHLAHPPASVKLTKTSERSPLLASLNIVLGAAGQPLSPEMGWVQLNQDIFVQPGLERPNNVQQSINVKVTNF